MKLNLEDSFSTVVPNRMAKIALAPDTPVFTDYGVNRLARLLHPEKQLLKVCEVIQEAEDTRPFVLVPREENGQLAYFAAGQYLSLTLKIGGETVTRPYSLFSSPRQALQGEYRLTIKRNGSGFVSRYLVDHWQAGTEVETSAPLGTFTYEPLRDAKNVVGIAGGSGITPFHSLAQAIADGDEDFTLTLLYGTRNYEDAVLGRSFEEICRRTDKVKVVYVLSEEEREGFEHGFITTERIRKYAPDGKYSLFLCGPQAMYRFVDREVAALALPRKYVRHEMFGAALEGETCEQYHCTVRMNGREETIPCVSEETLLVAMERAGIYAPSHCRSGICGWYRSRLVSGQVRVDDRVDGRRAADVKFGYIHPCCTYPAGDTVIEVPEA